MQKNEKRAKILIVDDEKTNLDMLIGFLKPYYQTSVAKNSEQASRRLEKPPLPDLILLDIMMPGMNGYEVCSDLKADVRTRDIPILFVSALDDTMDKIRAFKSGGVDYITKPFQAEEVLARVKTHLKLREARQQLEKQNIELKAAAQLREDIDHIMRHDLKGPLNSIVGLPGIIMQDQTLNPDHVKHLNIIEGSGYKMLDMINRSLDLLKMEQGTYEFEPTAVELVRTVKKIISDNKAIAHSKYIGFEVLIKDQPVTQQDACFVQGEELLCYSLLSNLLKNSVEASPEREKIHITLTHNKLIQIDIHNKGSVPKEIQNRFFEKYVSCGKRSGTGIGTYSAKLMAEVQGGSIRMSTSSEEGTTVSVRLQPFIDRSGESNLSLATHKEKNASFDSDIILRSFLPSRLLIVDDDANNQNFLKHLLNSKNLVIDFAGNGKAAIQKMIDTHYDLVVMDLEMPVMDGKQAVEEFRRWEKDNSKESVPTMIVALSAHDNTANINNCMDSGFDDFLIKPIKKSQLIETLLKFLKTDNKIKIEAGARTSEQAGKNIDPQKTHVLNDVFSIEIDSEMKNLIPTFLDSQKAGIDSIKVALTNRDFEEIKRISHKLKGTSHMYGFENVSQLFSGIELADAHKDMSTIDKILGQLEEYFDKINITYVKS